MALLYYKSCKNIEYKTKYNSFKLIMENCGWIKNRQSIDVYFKTSHDQIHFFHV